VLVDGWPINCGESGGAEIVEKIFADRCQLADAGHGSRQRWSGLPFALLGERDRWFIWIRSPREFDGAGLGLWSSNWKRKHYQPPMHTDSR
jgi:hypothetical protein